MTEKHVNTTWKQLEKSKPWKTVQANGLVSPTNKL